MGKINRRAITIDRNKKRIKPEIELSDGQTKACRIRIKKLSDEDINKLKRQIQINNKSGPPENVTKKRCSLILNENNAAMNERSLKKKVEILKKVVVKQKEEINILQQRFSEQMEDIENENEGAYMTAIGVMFDVFTQVLAEIPNGQKAIKRLKNLKSLYDGSTLDDNNSFEHSEQDTLCNLSVNDLEQHEMQNCHSMVNQGNDSDCINTRNQQKVDELGSTDLREKKTLKFNQTQDVAGAKKLLEKTNKSINNYNFNSQIVESELNNLFPGGTSTPMPESNRFGLTQCRNVVKWYTELNDAKATQLTSPKENDHDISVTQNQIDCEFDFDSMKININGYHEDKVKTEEYKLNFVNKYHELKFNCKPFIKNGNKHIMIKITNNGMNHFAINELKSIVQLKINNTIFNICNFENIVLSKIKLDRNIFTQAKFIVILNKEMSRKHFADICERNLNDTALNLIPMYTIKYLKFFLSESQ